MYTIFLKASKNEADVDGYTATVVGVVSLWGRTKGLALSRVGDALDRLEEAEREAATKPQVAMGADK